MMLPAAAPVPLPSTTSVWLYSAVDVGAVGMFVVDWALPQAAIRAAAAKMTAKRTEEYTIRTIPQATEHTDNPGHRPHRQEGRRPHRQKHGRCGALPPVWVGPRARMNDPEAARRECSKTPPDRSQSGGSSTMPPRQERTEVSMRSPAARVKQNRSIS